jgi:hypothetical protein
MDKAEAIKILKDFHDESAIFSVRTALETLHPELRESIDERVRKGLITAVSGTLGGNKLFGTDVTREEALAWLEKQGQPRMQYGITINSVEYELIEDYEADECERCALKGQCNNIGDDTLCNAIFGSDIAAHRRFKKKTK